MSDCLAQNGLGQVKCPSPTHNADLNQKLIIIRSSQRYGDVLQKY